MKKNIYVNDFCHKLAAGQVSLNLPKVLFKFLKLKNSIILCKVTGKRVKRGAGCGLKILGICTYTELEKAVAWMEGEIKKEMNTTENMKNNCLKWNFRLLLFPCPLIRKKM